MSAARRSVPGQIEQLLGSAMRSVHFGAHMVMHELAPQRLEQCGVSFNSSQRRRARA